MLTEVVANGRARIVYTGKGWAVERLVGDQWRRVGVSLNRDRAIRIARRR